MGAIEKTLTNDIITHLTGASNYSCLHYADGTSELFSKPLQYFEERLPDFIRIHKMALVNPRFIKAIQVPSIKKMNGLLTMKTGLVFSISRRRMSWVKEHPYWQTDIFVTS